MSFLVSVVGSFLASVGRELTVSHLLILGVYIALWEIERKLSSIEKLLKERF